MLFEVNYGFLLSHATEASLCPKEEIAAETIVKQKINIEYSWVTCRPDGVHILCSRLFVDPQYIVINFTNCLESLMP
jgi:hypothetical protein